MKIIFDCYKDGFFEFIELPISKDSRRIHQKISVLNLCECNCGEFSRPGNRFIKGHSSKGKTYEELYGEEKAKTLKESIKQRHLGKTISKKQKEAARQANLGKKCSEETKILMGTAKLGNKNALGYKHTKEAKEKIRIANLGKKKSEETKEKMRIAQNTPEAIENKRVVTTKRLEEGKFGWFISRKKESYPEFIFREFLEFCGAIRGVDFVQEYHIGRYSLDFAYVDEKRYIEIDGQQHLTFEAITRDTKRDKWLQERGWVGIRIPARGLKEFLYKRHVLS